MSKVKVIRETKTCPSLQGKRKARAKPMARERQRKSKIKENDCDENMFDANHI